MKIKTKFKQTELGEIPEDWEIQKIGDLFDVFAGGDLAKINYAKNQNADFKYPIYSNSLDNKGLYGFSDDFQYKSECVTITARGDIGRAEFRNKPFNAIVRLLVLQPKTEISCRYVADYINTALNFQHVGSAVNQLTRPMIEDRSIALPNYSEQQKIAEVLGALDEKIELNRKMNKTLESLAQAIFKKWFIDVADPNWKTKKLRDRIIIKKGKNITKKEVADGNISVIAAGLEPSCYHNFANTSAPVITISASGANAGYIKLHDKNVWASDCSYIDKTVTAFVYFYYLFFRENQNLISDLQKGSAQPHVYPNDLMNLDIADFPEDLIQKFENKVSPLFKQISNNNSEIETLSQNRDSLLPRLMSGKLRVR